MGVQLRKEETIPQYHRSALQSQKAVTAHLKSEQLLPFDFAMHRSGH